MPSASPIPSPSVRQAVQIDRLDEVHDGAAWDALARDWDALVDERHPGAVFRSPSWSLTWWKHFSRHRELRLHTLREGGRILAVLPAYRERGRLGRSTLRLLGDGMVGSDYLGVAAPSIDAPQAARLLAARLLDDEPSLAFDGVLDGDPLDRALVELAAERGALCDRRPLLPCPYLDIAAQRERGLDYAAWLAGLPQGTGAQLLRRRRWLERQRGFRLEIAVDEEQVSAALEALLHLHAARWSEEGGSDGIAGETTLRFHREAARTLARQGRARIYVLHVEGEPRAALYGFERGGRFSFYQSGLDPAWRQRSVGTVVLGAAIEDAFARDLDEFDFLRGEESYKLRFASGQRQLVRLRLASGRRGRTWFFVEQSVATARRVVKRLLPEAAVEWVRRRERSRSANGGTTGGQDVSGGGGR